MSDKKKFPRTGFGRLAGDMVRRYYTHDVARDSAALTYYLLFAIFPLLIFISTLLGLLELDGAYIASVLEPLLPADVLNVLQSYLDYVSANQSRQLLWFSLVFSIWFPMRAAGCLMHSVRKAFGCGAPESMWRSQLRILLFTVCLILSIAITLVLVVVGRTVLEFAGRIITVSEAFITAWSYLRFVALALVMTVLLVLLYMLSQGRRRPLREVLPGVGSTLAAWLVLLFVSVVVEYGTPRALAFRDVCTILMAGIAIPLAFQCLMQLRLMEHGGGLVMIPLVAAFSSDSAALFAGMALGRHKLAPAVSPKKTVEGSIGGLAGGMLGIVIFRIVFFLVTEVQLNIAWCVLLGLVGAVLGQLGDLSFSAIKRECGVKDYGRLLPGHGGVLDRFDSVIFASPVVWLLIKSITLY